MRVKQNILQKKTETKNNFFKKNDEEPPLESSPMNEVHPKCMFKPSNMYTLSKAKVDTGDGIRLELFDAEDLYCLKQVHVVQHKTTIKKEIYTINLEHIEDRNMFDFIIEELMRNDFVKLKSYEKLSVNLFRLVKRNTFVIDYSIIGKN
jgi:hypothetical protein